MVDRIEIPCREAKFLRELAKAEIRIVAALGDLRGEDELEQPVGWVEHLRNPSRFTLILSMGLAALSWCPRAASGMSFAEEGKNHRILRIWRVLDILCCAPDAKMLACEFR
jgi:hypothetical protein